MLNFLTGTWLSKGSLNFIELYAQTTFTFTSGVILVSATTNPSTDFYYLIADSYQIFDINGKNAVSNWKPINGNDTLLIYPIETSEYRIGVFLKTWVQDCTLNFWEFQP